MTRTEATTHDPRPAPTPSVRAWRVVVVDDSPDDRAKARRLLLKGADRRYTFTEAETGAAAVRVVLADPPDCLLLDYNLPDLDAPDVLAALTGPDGLVVCPVVVVTGSAGADFGRAVLRAGAQDYIGKDWLTPQGLARAVENAAERWAMARELRTRTARDTYRLALTEALRPPADPKAAQLAATRVLGRHLGASRVVYAEVEPDGVVVVEPGYADGVAHIPGRYRLDDFGPILRREYGAGRPVVAADVPTDPAYTDAERTHYAGIGVVANLGMPLMKDGRLVSILSVHQSVPRRWTDEEVALVAETAEVTWSHVQIARAEADVRQSEERLRLAVEAGGMGTWDMDVRTGRTVWSANHFAMLGYEPNPTGEATYQMWEERVHPDDLPGVLAAVEAARRDRTVFAVEHRVVRADDGRVTWLAPCGRFRYDADGQAVRFVGVDFDITERKEAEVALRETSQQLRMSLSVGRADAFTWDIPANEVRRLHGIASTLGPTDAPVPFESVLAVVHPDDRDAFERQVRQAVERPGREYTNEYRVVGPDGSSRWISDTGRVEFDADGRPLRLVGLATDITARKRAERQIAGQNQTLEAVAAGKGLTEILTLTTRTLESLLPGAAASVLLADAEGRRLFCGAAENLPAEYNAAIDGFAIGDGVGSCGTAAFRREPVYVADIARDPLWADYRQLAEAHRLAACWSHPILAPDGRLLGTFALYFADPRPATPGDRELLAATARVAGVAIHRKRTEDELRESETRLRLALEAADAGSWSWDAATNLSRWDERYHALYGFAPDQPKTFEAWVSSLHPDDRPAVLARLDRMRATPGDDRWEAEFRCVHPRLGARWHYGLGRCERDAAGAVVRIAGIDLDVTDRKATEAALARRNEGLAVLGEAAALLLSTGDQEQILGDLFAKTARHLGADVFANYTIEPGEGDAPQYLRLGTAGGLDADTRRRFARLEMGESLCGLTAASRTPTYLPDARADARPEARPVQALGVASYISCPFLAGDRTLGVLSFASTTPNKFGPEDLEFVTAVSHHVAAAMERQRAEAALRASEERFRAVFEHAGTGIAVTSPDGPFLRCNPAFERMVGYTEGELQALRFADIVHPDDRAENLALGRRLRAREITSFEIENRYVHKAAHPVWVRKFISMLYDPAGRPICHVVLATDVTARRQAEQAVKESESFYRQTLESIPGMVFTCTPDGACDYVSDQWLEFTGIPAADQRGSGWVQALHPDDRERVIAAWRTTVEGRGKFDLEYRVRRHDGLYEWFKVRCRAIRDEGGRIARWFGAAVNIEDLKQAEAGRVAREQELQALADNTPDILTRFDRLLRHVFVNAAVEKATGRPQAEFLGKSNRELGMPADLCDQWEGAIRAVFDTGNHRSLEFAYPTPAGVRHYAARLVPEFAADGAVEFVLGVTHDVTERKRFEQKLADQDKRKDEFLATLAHELRNPLAPLRNGLQVLRLTGDAGAAVKARDMMERQLGHLVHLVDDLLDISRVSQGKITLKREPLTVREAVEAAVEACRPTVDDKGHALTVDLPGEPLAVDADRTRLVQVVANLLTNAAKYSEPGGRITVSARRDGGEAVIAVSDTGVGIAAEVLPTLWNMFAQVRDTIDKAQGGLGIGLSLVKKLVEMHRGTVAAESKGVGFGSTFTVRLPLAAAEPTAAPTPTQNGTHGSQPIKWRVLVVDDNVDGAESLAMLLGISGLETKTAHSGPEALAAVRAFTPDVAFLDIGLPAGMDGYEVARRFRAEPATAGTVLVALTGWGGAEDKRRAKEAGFDHHLTKPVETAALMKLLAGLTVSTG